MPVYDIKGFSVDTPKPIPSFKNAKRAWQGKVVTNPDVKSRIRDLEWGIKASSLDFELQTEDVETLTECWLLCLTAWFGLDSLKTIPFNTLVANMQRASMQRKTE